MSLKDIFKQQSKGMESLATTGTIGMHMVSGPLVGFAIGYGLDAWLETGPWLKLVFLVIGIIAGFPADGGRAPTAQLRTGTTSPEAPEGEGTKTGGHDRNDG